MHSRTSGRDMRKGTSVAFQAALLEITTCDTIADVTRLQCITSDMGGRNMRERTFVTLSAVALVEITTPDTVADVIRTAHIGGGDVLPGIISSFSSSMISSTQTGGGWQGRWKTSRRSETRRWIALKQIIGYLDRLNGRRCGRAGIWIAAKLR